MNLLDLYVELGRNPYKYQFQGTNVNSIEYDVNGDVIFNIDISSIQNDLKCAKENEKRLEEELEKVEEKKEELESKLQNAEYLLESVKDEKSGISIKIAIENMEEAQESARKSKENSMIWSKEVTALRKRKGVEANYFAYRFTVIELLNNLVRADNGYKLCAQNLLNKINGK